MTLATLQQAFAATLRDDPQPLPIKDGRVAADKRLQIYRNHYVVTLTDTLKCVYPKTCALLGEACFDAVARHHAMVHPPQTGVMEDYGAQFDATLRALPNIIEPVPCCAELARFEWAQVVLTLTPPSPAFEGSALASLSPEQQAQVCLPLNHQARLFESDYAVSDVWQAIATEQFEGLVVEKQQALLLVANQDKVHWYALSAHHVSVLNACPHTPLGALSETQLACVSEIAAMNAFTTPTTACNAKE